MNKKKIERNKIVCFFFFIQLKKLALVERQTKSTDCRHLSLDFVLIFYNRMNFFVFSISFFFFEISYLVLINGLFLSFLSQQIRIHLNFLHKYDLYASYSKTMAVGRMQKEFRFHRKFTAFEKQKQTFFGRKQIQNYFQHFWRRFRIYCIFCVSIVRSPSELLSILSSFLLSKSCRIHFNILPLMFSCNPLENQIVKAHFRNSTPFAITN